MNKDINYYLSLNYPFTVRPDADDGGYLILIAKIRSFKKNVSNKIESVENELKEIRVMLEEKKR